MTLQQRHASSIGRSDNYYPVLAYHGPQSSGNYITGSSISGAASPSRCGRTRVAVRNGPQTVARKPKAPTMRASQWEPHRESIRELYLEGDISLDRLMVVMKEEHGLEATKRQYISQISRWGYDKKVKTHEMQFIAALSHKRSILGKTQLNFYVRDRAVNQAKIDRFLKDHPDCKTLGPLPAAPSDVSYESVPELEAPALKHDTTNLPIECPEGRYDVYDILSATPNQRHDLSLTIQLKGSSSAFESYSEPSTEIVDLSDLLPYRENDRRERYYKKREERRLREEILLLKTTQQEDFFGYLDKVYDYAYMLNSRCCYELPMKWAPRLYSTLHRHRNERRTLMAMRFLAVVLDNCSHFQEALEISEEAVRLTNESNSFQAADVIPAKLILARNLLRTSRFEEVNELCLQSLSGIQQHPDEHMRSSLSHRLLSTIKELHATTGSLHPTLTQWVRALCQGSDSLYSKFDLESYRNAAEIAYFLEVFRNRAGAMRLTEHAIQGFVSIVGPVHRYTLWSQSFLSRLIAEEGDFKFAEFLAQSVVQSARELYSPGSYYIENYTSPLARIRFSQGEVDSAIDLQTNVVSTAVHALGEIDDKTLAHTETLGCMYGMKGDIHKAQDILLKCLRLRENIFGPQDPRTISLRECMRGNWKLGYRRSLRGFPT